MLEKNNNNHVKSGLKFSQIDEIAALEKKKKNAKYCEMPGAVITNWQHRRTCTPEMPVSSASLLQVQMVVCSQH